MNHLHILICPLCQTHFVQIGNAITCEHHHTFDIAKEGYINLLTYKLPPSMGDTKEMLLARRAFLERGHYQSLITTITTLLYDYLKTEVDLPYLSMLDAGCGEGYYLGRIQHALEQQLPDAHIEYLGIDIAKEATRMAAKRYKNIHFLVANLKERFVFASDSLHILLNIFAPRNVEEFARVLTLGGIALVVIPAPQHLRQLREALGLLNIEEHKQEHVLEQFAPYLTYIGTASVNSTLRLNKEEILQTVMMTPNYRHLSTEVKHKMSTMEGLETEITFTCLLFRKDNVYKKEVQK